ncbi:unnamed protein product [Blepharisma stoltei]|uniref:Uncharacterized protein n=1 Tax=Blepharisma stoltei TaxID=1481888 RepID=A0AAU9JN42_9CILI|nr:unnamed protein product [Blepharisma stoltei]
MENGCFSFHHSLTRINELPLLNNPGVYFIIVLFVIYVISIVVGNKADNKKPLSNLKRRPSSTSRSDIYIAPSEFRHFDEDLSEISRVEN